MLCECIIWSARTDFGWLFAFFRPWLRRPNEPRRARLMLVVFEDVSVRVMIGLESFREVAGNGNSVQEWAD